jgi:hypothetical protein
VRGNGLDAGVAEVLNTFAQGIAPQLRVRI